MRNILIVDDSASMRKMATTAVHHFGLCKVFEASDGLEAIEQLAKHQFSLVISDLNMPFIDGLKLLEWIRTQSTNPEVPVIILSTETNSRDFQRAMGRGASAYLTKPIQAPTLRKILRDILGRERSGPHQSTQPSKPAIL